DAVAISLKRRPHVIFPLRAQTAARVGAAGGLWGENLPLARFELLAKVGHDVKRGARRARRVSPFPLIPANSGFPLWLRQRPREHRMFRTSKRKAFCVLGVLCVLPCDVAKEAGAVRERADAEHLRQRLADIGERAAGTEVRAADMRTGDEQRHVLAGVIGA